ncbi:hypothetical protein [Pyrobaculum aerophilum]|uniref:Uncharacterized protein n=1 Tax=Pyrobaculum aerophilum TaxID=13773 RepID=A0A371R0B8_9CREN|nr:hypothetical protein [Pyrobaculum aerophilum]RFA95031.1 hypothetical protein CGL51_08590 [Pyrobaculum aerophilum]RFA96744.1 hypothetical protein CGL52_10620 [Pyrobaculum aerophilum]
MIDWEYLKTELCKRVRDKLQFLRKVEEDCLAGKGGVECYYYYALVRTKPRWYNSFEEWLADIGERAAAPYLRPIWRRALKTAYMRLFNVVYGNWLREYALEALVAWREGKPFPSLRQSQP